MYMAKGLWRFAVGSIEVRTEGFTMASAPRPSQAEGVIVVVGNHLNSDTPQVVASSVHPKCADIPSHGQ
jgi:hypothetical protein